MKKLLAYVLMLTMLVSMVSLLSACGEEKKTSKKENGTTATVPADDPQAQPQTPAATGKLEADIKVVQIGTMEGDTTFINHSDGGIYYKDDTGKYAVTSFDGAFSSGYKYEEVKYEGEYFAVRTAIVKDANDIKDINKTALLNGKGQEILPASFACFDVLNEKFVKAYTATAVTTAEDEAILTCQNDSVSSYVSSDGTMYKGTWAIYNLETGKKISGAEGTGTEYPYAYGGIVYYSDADYNKHIYTENGTKLDASVTVFENGTYSVEGRDGGVYKSNGDPLFTYSLTSYIPQSSAGDYYIASLYENSEYTYVVMDSTGAVISKEFKDYITVKDDIIICDEKAYDFDGNSLSDNAAKSVYDDTVFGKAYFLSEGDDSYTMIDNAGNVIFNGTDDDSVSIYTYYFAAVKDGFVYCYDDQDYTIEGSPVGSWIAKVETANYHYDLVETIGGTTLITGYESYTIAETEDAMYVYAKFNGGYDVFQVIAGDVVVNVTEKRENLLDELIQAFENEGITVTVDKETGEMSMDASVLFGGDSAELTDEGKAFLDKFTKAYTSIVFSQKYKDFVTRTMVEGHIAPVAGVSYESGLPLSEERAENVKAYCLTVKTSVDSDTLDAALDPIGYSNTKPVYDASGNVDMDASRRVSFRIMINVDAQ